MRTIRDEADLAYDDPDAEPTAEVVLVSVPRGLDFDAPFVDDVVKLAEAGSEVARHALGDYRPAPRAAS